MVLRLLLPTLAMVMGLRAAAAPPVPVTLLRDGDIIFHASASAQSQAIQLATKSRYSHCGLLFRRGGSWWVFEAVEPVKATPLAAWIARGQGGHYAVRRLRDAATALTPAALQRMKAAATQLVGKHYDLYFGWSDDRIYCSELIWKVYKSALGRELGKLQQLQEFDLTHPVVQRKLRERYGFRLPLDEPVISPARIFSSPELVEVVTR
ncbi:MAG: YiiX family permuted papain-like enzyme [Hymenobacteraceae bacterium]|nr:YiiX family permuted papain-like enzyme [Hymenobacteraceae bacterium]